MSKKAPHVSICILNKNGIARLKKCIPSILAQREVSSEIIVFDDGSTDKSLEYLNSIKNLTIITGTKRGYQYGKNQLVKKARGKYVLLLDNDIELTNKDTLKKFLNSFLKTKQIGFLSPLVIDLGNPK